MRVSFGYNYIEATGIMFDPGHTISIHQKDPPILFIFETGEDTVPLVNQLFASGYADLRKYNQRKKRVELED